MPGLNQDPRWRPLFDVLRAFRTEWPRRGWTWDSRMSCLASTFGVPDEEQARAAVQRAMPYTWTEKTLRNAPPAYVDLADRTGGLRSGQLLFTGQPVGHVLPYGLWWPWGNGETVSLRVGLSGAEDNQDPWPDVREVFGAST